MNKILSIERQCGAWRVEAIAPSGQRLVILVSGSKTEALEKAQRAEPDPA